MHDRSSGTTSRKVGRILVLVAVTAAVFAVTASPAFAAAPSKPTSFSVTVGPSVGNMTLRWRPPATPSGTISSYAYQVQVDSNLATGTWSTPPTVIPGGGSVRSAVVPCPASQTPTHGCAYRIVANNPVAGAAATSGVVLWTAPSAPLMRFPIAGPGAAVTISWRPPLNTGGLSVGYQYDVNNGDSWSAPNVINMGTVNSTSTPDGIVYSTPVPCALAPTNTTGCKYRMQAVSLLGTSPYSAERTAPLRVPGTVTSLASTTTSVALGPGQAMQTISWNAPTSGGGLVVNRYQVFVCSTALGNACDNISQGWTQVGGDGTGDITGNPPATFISNQCPANGTCVYEVWAFNGVNDPAKSWRLAASHPAAPSNLTVTASTTAAGLLDLQWIPVSDVGTGFGHYVLWECNVTSNCVSGSWTTTPADAAPWTKTDLVGTPATTTYQCTIPVACQFRVGYVDSLGNIGGVSNTVTATGLDAPGLTATPGAAIGSVNLSWTQPATGPIPTGYHVYRNTGSGYASLILVGGNVTSNIDTTCGAGVVCSYKVRALYSVGSSADSAPSSATGTTPAPDTTPPVVTLTTVNGAAQTFPLATNANVTTVGGACGTATGDVATVSVAIAGAASENGTTACTAGAWTYTLVTPLSADGASTATATQSDGVPNVGTSGAKTITVDKTAPAVTLTTVNGGAQTFPFLTNATITTVGGACGTATGDTATVSVAIAGAASENGTTACTAGAWTYTLVTPLSADGAYTATATQSDGVPNIGTSGAKTITVDKTAPAVTLTTVNGAAQTFPLATNATIASVGGACGTATGDATTVSVVLGGAASENGSTACTAGAWTYTLVTPLSADGAYTATATQSDTATNTGTSGAKTITVDTTGPAVTLTAPIDSEITSTTPSINGARGQASGDLAPVTVNIYAGTTATGTPVQTLNDNGTGATWAVTAATLAPGTYTVQAQQSDSATNAGTSAAVTFTAA